MPPRNKHCQPPRTAQARSPAKPTPRQNVAPSKAHPMPHAPARWAQGSSSRHRPLPGRAEPTPLQCPVIGCSRSCREIPGAIGFHPANNFLEHLPLLGRWYVLSCRFAQRRARQAIWKHGMAGNTGNFGLAGAQFLCPGEPQIHSLVQVSGGCFLVPAGLCHHQVLCSRGWPRKRLLR